MTQHNLSKIVDDNGNEYLIKAKGLEDQVQISLTGDVSGSATTDFTSDPSISTAIGAKKVTTSKIDDSAVTTDKINDKAVTIDKIADAAKGGAVQDNDGVLATHAQVKNYVDAIVAGEGKYRGMQTVATINSWTVANLNNGDRVITADAGTITFNGQSLAVVADQELVLWKDTSTSPVTAVWQTSEGNYKLKQTAKSDPTASGNAFSFIANLSQDSNGDITATKKTIPTAVATGTTGETNGLMTAADKQKLDGIASGAEVNQNAFSNVKVGSTTVAADTKTDTLELVAGGATTITPDATNDKITISSTDQSVTAVGNHYTPATDSSAEKDASGGAATQLPTSSTGTLVQVVTGVQMDAKGHVTGVVSKGLWSPNTTYSNASLGQGYGACDTAEATAAKVVTLSGYALETGGIVAVKFTYGLCASATMNINSKGAKSIFIDGAAVTATTAKRVLAGDIAYFIYDGTQYQFLGTDKAERKFDFNYRASDNALVITKKFGTVS